MQLAAFQLKFTAGISAYLIQRGAEQVLTAAEQGHARQGEAAARMRQRFDDFMDRDVERYEETRAFIDQKSAAAQVACSAVNANLERLDDIANQ